MAHKSFELENTIWNDLVKKVMKYMYEEHNYMGTYVFHSTEEKHRPLFSLERKIWFNCSVVNILQACKYINSAEIKWARNREREEDSSVLYFYGWNG